MIRALLYTDRPTVCTVLHHACIGILGLPMGKPQQNLATIGTVRQSHTYVCSDCDTATPRFIARLAPLWSSTSVSTLTLDQTMMKESKQQEEKKNDGREERGRKVGLSLSRIQSPHPFTSHDESLPPSSLHERAKLLDRPIIPGCILQHGLYPIQRQRSQIREHPFNELQERNPARGIRKYVKEGNTTLTFQ